MDDDAHKFIQELETRHGSKLSWRTYATWYATTKGVAREFGVFLYKVNDSFFFEDFERQPALFGFSLRPRKNREPFVKYEDSFACTGVESVRTVSRSNALKIIRQPSHPVKDASWFDKAFRQVVEMVLLKDGTVHFFEVMDRKEFRRRLNDGSV
ncbi:MAG: hypothetical protein EWM48_01845 [Sphaerochaeta sp.]|jgi:hypothetical protein|nr:MAG: hypothetical protein EWM48_01845 [Sphaerochaeta sp.]HOR81016.1 hypothetical protein [Sphaerochaeta sp.]